MLFIIVVLATYIWRGAMAHPNHWTFGVDFKPNTDSQSDKMQSLHGSLCRTSQSDLLAKKFVITKIKSNYTKCKGLQGKQKLIIYYVLGG